MRRPARPAHSHARTQPKQPFTTADQSTIYLGYSDSAAFQLDQPGDSISLIHTFGTNYRGYAYFNVAGRAGASIAGFYSDCADRFPVWASKLPPGQLVSHRPFVPAQKAFLAEGNPGSCAGEFSDGGIGYIGFKFNSGGGDQYGWVRIRTHRRFQQNFKLIDYAWGDVGDRIRAGQTSTNEVVPGEGSLGWLALGAAGLLAWRKSKSQTAQL